MAHPPALPRLAQRMGSWWWLKALGTSAFMWGFFVFYFQLLEHPRVPALEMPLLAWDGMLPFHPLAWFFYFSLWIYTSLPAALQPSFGHLLYYGLSIALVCVLGLTIFFWWPTMVPASYGLPPGHPWNLLAGVDAPGNAFPSLHVATSAFSAAWLDAQFKAMNLSRRWRWGNAIWCVAIILSTLSTRQHVLLDVLGGVVLGIMTAWATLALLARCRSRLLPMTA
jgi:membrane-associated phospholipid phosphatase